MNALTPYSPSAPPLPLRRRRLPLPVGSHPSAGWPQAGAAPAGWPLVADDASARRRPSCWRRTRSRSPACGLLPLRVPTPCRGPGCSRLPPYKGASAIADRPLQPAWPWVVAPTWGLAIAGRPSMGGWPWLAAPPPCCLRCENGA
ncbi:hypothetical protein B296_00047209 [Ensete ventricosum]|uniref:Uncharacterized protein n=1 Tax=Ensete ventricosum TaxID=4639 RepID=A0A426XBT3_ENSVE|nr:hypothetical protein B296_00047209 [Ensete ventricosum]